MLPRDIHAPEQSVVLIAGIGNVFLGDDGFGVEVVRRMSAGGLPQGAIAKDFGTHRFDLACELLKEYSAAVLVDTVSRGGAPGTLYRVAPDISRVEPTGSTEVNASSVDAARVLSLAVALGPAVESIFVIGCEPSPRDSTEANGVGLSPPVLGAIGPAIEMIEETVRRFAETSAVEADRSVLRAAV